MQMLLTISSRQEGAIALEQDLWAVARPYEQVEEFDARAAQWTVLAQPNIEYVEYTDGIPYVFRLDPEFYVIREGILWGFFLDGCLLQLDDPAHHSKTTWTPSPRFYGRNYIGTATYSLIFRPEDRILLSADGKTLESWPKNATGVARIPEGVEVLGPCAMYGCNGLTQIQLPPSVRKIKELALPAGFPRASILRSGPSEGAGGQQTCI